MMRNGSKRNKKDISYSGHRRLAKRINYEKLLKVFIKLSTIANRRRSFMSNRLSGVIVPLLTPFGANSEINQQVLYRLVDRLILAGVNGLMVAGTTGEGALLTQTERMSLTEWVIERSAGRVPVIVQAGAITTQESIKLAQHAVQSGATAISIISPYFFRYSEEALQDHFCEIAQAVPDSFPVYLYNIPQFTFNAITPAVSAAVAERCPNVVGEKDSSGDLNGLVLKRTIRGGDFDLLIGTDALVLPALVLGACGAVAGNANIFPELFIQLFNAHYQANLTAAEHWQRQIHISTSAFQADRSLFKAALRYQGLDMGSVRPPQKPASPEAERRCLQKLIDAGLLQA
jgi:dihydrodipicolinate synthase/N-acetylneuraminate lyase